MYKNLVTLRRLYFALKNVLKDFSQGDLNLIYEGINGEEKR